MSAPASTSQGNPSVSVVMTTYNGAPYVEEAVRSVLEQSNCLVELVIIDDGSTDATPEIVGGFALSDPRIRFEAVPHSGIASSRNKGLARARGEFITFLDQDDLCPPGRIARQHARLVAEPALAAVFGRTIMFESGVQNGDVVAHQASSQTMLISAALFRHKVFRDVGPFDTAYAIADDFDFVLRLIESGKEVAVEASIGVLYRRHAGQHTADRAATRSECTRALQRSLRRRRESGIGSLNHPLMAAGNWIDRQ